LWAKFLRSSCSSNVVSCFPHFFGLPFFFRENLAARHHGFLLLFSALFGTGLQTPLPSSRVGFPRPDLTHYHCRFCHAVWARFRRAQSKMAIPFVGNGFLISFSDDVGASSANFFFMIEIGKFLPPPPPSFFTYQLYPLFLWELSGVRDPFCGVFLCRLGSFPRHACPPSAVRVGVPNS